MATIRGSFADSVPVVSVVVGAESRSVPLTAVVDTGFDGFAAVPVRAAESVGLRPRGSARVQYADGSDEIRHGVVHVTSGEALVGVDLLRSFDKIFVLSVSSGVVLLVDSMAEAR